MTPSPTGHHGKWAGKLLLSDSMNIGKNGLFQPGSARKYRKINVQELTKTVLIQAALTAINFVSMT